MLIALGHIDRNSGILGVAKLGLCGVPFILLSHLLPNILNPHIHHINVWSSYLKKIWNANTLQGVWTRDYPIAVFVFWWLSQNVAQNHMALLITPLIDAFQWCVLWFRFTIGCDRTNLVLIPIDEHYVNIFITLGIGCQSIFVRVVLINTDLLVKSVVYDDIL